MLHKTIPFVQKINLSRCVPPKYTLTDHLWSYLQRYAEKHRAASPRANERG